MARTKRVNKVGVFRNSHDLSFGYTKAERIEHEQWLKLQKKLDKTSPKYLRVKGVIN